MPILYWPREVYISCMTLDVYATPLSHPGLGGRVRKGGGSDAQRRSESRRRGKPTRYESVSSSIRLSHPEESLGVMTSGSRYPSLHKAGASKWILRS